MRTTCPERKTGLKTSLRGRRRTRYFTPIEVDTKVDGQCDKLATVVGRLLTTLATVPSTIASVVNTRKSRTLATVDWQWPNSCKFGKESPHGMFVNNPNDKFSVKCKLVSKILPTYIVSTKDVTLMSPSS